MTAPYFASYPNPAWPGAPCSSTDQCLSHGKDFVRECPRCRFLKRYAGLFTAYEVQTVRLYAPYAPGNGGDPFFESVTRQCECAEDWTNAVGPVLYGVYGRTADGLAEHICDRRTKEQAEDLLAKMGVAI